MKIGILGGSFDPIHNGHLHMAKQVLKEYELDKIIFMPAGHSPNKSETEMMPADIRLTMVQLALEGTKNLEASSLEVDSEERSYTYRTLQKLSEVYPNDDFYFIMGADSLDYFDQWYHPEIICQLATILVVNRDEFSYEDLSGKIGQLKCLFPADIRIVSCEKYDISSRKLREQIKKGENVSEYIPKDVLSYIKEHQLYRGA